MKYTVKLLFAACVIFSAQTASAEVTVISKKSAQDLSSKSNQDYHRYEKEIQKLDAESSQILSTLGRNRQPASITDAGTKSGFTVTMIDKKK